MVACAGLQALIALSGDQIVGGMYRNIDKYASEPLNLMMDKVAKVKVNKGTS